MRLFQGLLQASRLGGRGRAVDGGAQGGEIPTVPDVEVLQRIKTAFCEGLAVGAPVGLIGALGIGANGAQATAEDGFKVSRQVADAGVEGIAAQRGGDDMADGEAQGSGAADALIRAKTDGCPLGDLAESNVLARKEGHVGDALDVVEGDGGGSHGIETPAVLLEGFIGESAGSLGQPHGTRLLEDGVKLHGVFLSGSGLTPL